MSAPQPPSAEALLALADERGRLAVRVTPNARKDGITIETDDGGISRIRIRTTAQPEKGKANKAVLKMLAKALGLSASRLMLVSGETARDKIIALAGIDDAASRTKP